MRLTVVIMLLGIAAVCGKSEACPPTRDYLTIGGNYNSGYKNLWKYNIYPGYLVLSWSTNIGGFTAIQSLYVAEDEYIYCGNSSTVGKVYKVEPCGDIDITWGDDGVFDVGNHVWSLLIDADGKSYTGCDWIACAEESRGLIRIDSDGTDIDCDWGDESHCNTAQTLAFKSGSYIIVGSDSGYYGDGYTLHKINTSTGDEVWHVTPYGEPGHGIHALAVDGDNIYCGGTRDTTNNKSVWRYTDSVPRPDPVWYADTGGAVEGMCFLPGGGLCVVGDVNSADNSSVWLYNSNGVLIDREVTGAKTWCVCTDGTYFYVGGERSGGFTVWRFDSDLGNKTDFIDTGSTVRAIVCKNGYYW